MYFVVIYETTPRRASFPLSCITHPLQDNCELSKFTSKIKQKCAFFNMSAAPYETAVQIYAFSLKNSLLLTIFNKLLSNLFENALLTLCFSYKFLNTELLFKPLHCAHACICKFGSNGNGITLFQVG